MPTRIQDGTGISPHALRFRPFHRAPTKTLGEFAVLNRREYSKLRCAILVPRPELSLAGFLLKPVPRTNVVLPSVSNP